MENCLEIKNNAYICTRNVDCPNRPGGFRGLKQLSYGK